MFKKILIANRGEIAVRIIRTCRELGFQTVAVFSDVDRPSPHVRFADEAWPLDGNSSEETYLRIDKLIDIGKRSGADAVHPGYGFLAENAEFAEKVIESGMTFIGPTPDNLRLAGDKAATDAAFDKANHIVREKFVINRVTGEKILYGSVEAQVYISVRGRVDMNQIPNGLIGLALDNLT